MLDNLDSIIESILFVAGEAVDVSDICTKIDATKQEVMAAVKKLQNKYSENNGIKIQSFNNKLQLSSNSNYSEYVSAVLNPIPSMSSTNLYGLSFITSIIFSLYILCIFKSILILNP